MSKDNPSDSFDSGDGSDPVYGDEDVPKNLTLNQINEITGRDYKDLNTALKSIKETYSMVGKSGKIQEENRRLREENEKKDGIIHSEIAPLKEQLFYSTYPQYKPYSDIIRAMGSNPAEVVENEAFKKIFADGKELEETRKSKTVLETNPRIGEAKTKLDEARSLIKEGRHDEASDKAVKSVLEAYDME